MIIRCLLVCPKREKLHYNVPQRHGTIVLLSGRQPLVIRIRIRNTMENIPQPLHKIMLHAHLENCFNFGHQGILWSNWVGKTSCEDRRPGSNIRRDTHISNIRLRWKGHSCNKILRGIKKIHMDFVTILPFAFPIFIFSPPFHFSII